MSLHSTPLDKITLTTLERLIRDRTRESRVIDYKREWNLTSDRSKTEFLCDVSSFANTDGGDLVYGMTETDGVPDAITGLTGLSQDKEQLRAEHVLAKGLDPRTAGIEFAQVELAEGRSVFIVRIARSATGPHMVVDNGRFYKRIAGGRIPMSTDEVRAAFSRSPQAADRAEEFRQARIERIVAGDPAVKLWSRNGAVLHLVPQEPVKGLDVRRGIHIEELRPPGTIQGYSHQMTQDGLLVPSHLEDNSVLSYVRLFKDGSIEAVLAGFSHERIIDAAYEGTMRRALERGGAVLAKLDVKPPYTVLLSLIGVKGKAFHRESFLPRPNQENVVIESANLLLPASVVETVPVDSDVVLKPAFDQVWHACGRFGSPHFDQEGRWKKGTREL